MTRSSESRPTHDENVARIAEWIRDIRTAMLTTVGYDGAIHSRPMVTQETAFDGNLWFFTNERSPKTAELLADRHVNVTYVDPTGHRYVSLCGQASLVRDKTRLEAMWTPSLKRWFPEGLDDAHLALIRVRVESAEYWNGPSGTVLRLMGLAKALLTGKGTAPADNEKLSLRRSA